MHDVIVIGAGPAGNMAAHRLSSLGHSVTVLDSRRKVGDKLCTGIIGRECFERFPPDQRDILAPASSATLVSPFGKSFKIAKGQPQAYIINRVAFVESLANQALDAGADYRLGVRVTSISLSGTDVEVRCSGEDGHQSLKARMVILASGFGSPLVRMVGLRNRGNLDFMMGSQAMVAAHELVDTEVYLGQSISPGSFGWLVPLPDSRALMGLVTRQKLNGHGHIDSFQRTLQSKGKVRDLVEKPKQWGIPLKPLPKTYGDRVLVVGDAAGFVKPTTGGGIYYALISGEIAAESAGEALRSDDLSARQLKRYESQWKAAIGKELWIGYYARRLYEVLGDQQIERLLSAFLTEEVQEELVNAQDFSFDWHSAFILKAVRHKMLGPVLRSLSPAVVPFLARMAGVRAS